MVKVTLVKTKTCVYCPTASKLWQDLNKSENFEYEEVDAMSEKGQELVSKYSIMSVPTTIIDGKVTFVGIPDKAKALEAVKK
jgi:glutaredoxin